MPDIDFAFLADAAETIPGQKFHVLGGGVARIGGRRFPLRHPHLALVIGLQVTAPETDREHEIRFVLLDPDGGEVAGATGSLVARSQRDARDAVADLLDRPLEPDVPGARRLLVPDPRERLGAKAPAAAAPRAPDDARRGRRGPRDRGRRMTERHAARRPARLGGPPRTTRRSTKPASWPPARGPARGRGPGIGSARWVAYLEPLPDRLRDDEPAALRATAIRCRAAYGVKDSVRDVLPAELTEPFLDSIDRLLRELNRARG